MQARNCNNCKYGQWDYENNHSKEVQKQCSTCGFFANWKMIRPVESKSVVKRLKIQKEDTDG